VLAERITDPAASGQSQDPLSTPLLFLGVGFKAEQRGVCGTPTRVNYSETQTPIAHFKKKRG
jgi:hypothetical protein